MRRWSLGWALAVCAIAAAGCSGSSNSAPSGPAKGVSGQYFYVTLAPATGGTVVSGDGSINCQSSGTGCGDAAYHQTKFSVWGTSVVLTAKPAAQYAFGSWGGDCAGQGAVCTLPGNGDYTVSVTFLSQPLPPTTVGRVYGYVKDGAAGVGGVKLTLGSASATTNANGAYVFEIAPGSYTLQTVASTQYAASAGVPVTVPIPDGVADPAGSCFLGGAKQGHWVPTTGQAGAGCLARQADIALTRASTFVAPATPPTVTVSAAGISTNVFGFGTTVTVGCGVGGVLTQVGTSPAVATLTGPDASGNYQFTTAALASASAVLAPTTEGRPGIVSINQSQAAALTYTFTCALNGGTATVKVPMVAALNANTATALRGEPFLMASYKGAANGLPGVTGPLWAAGADTTNGGAGSPDGSTWRAHDAVQIPPNAVVVLDGPAGANFKFCTGASDSYAGTCGTNTDSTNATNQLAAHPGWVFANWTVGATLYVASDQIAASMTPNIPVKPQIWGGWDLTSTPGGQNPLNADGSINPSGPAPTVWSCGLCHVAPGLFVGVVNGQNSFELGPTEPVIGYKESKHARAGIDGGSNTHFSIQACGGCHTVGYERNLPGNKGFSDVLGSYTNDFLFEGGDPTIWEADLAQKNPAAALLNNVQCGNCHGPTPKNPNHTASMSSRICGTCHNGHDPQFEQWSTSKHANLSDAVTYALGHGGRDQTYCARCHLGQGYFMYVKALVSGNPDKLGNAAPAGAPSTALVTPLLCSDAVTSTNNACPTTQTTGLLTAQNVDAITCQTCHDPHSLEVRIKDADTANGMLVAGGFKVTNAGAGAICASCHNTRNGIVGAVSPNLNTGVVSTGGTPMQHNDATPLTSNTSNNFGMTGPHTAAQADVYFAGNGYLLCNSGTASGACPMPTTPNPHANATYFADTCAECHVKRLSAATAGTPSNHTFAVDEGTCQNCHGAGVTYIASRQVIVNRMMGEYLVSLANVLRGAGVAVVNGKLGTATTAADYTVTSAISSVAVSGGYMGITLDFTFSNGDVVTGCSVNNIFADAAKTIPVLWSAGTGTDKVYGKVAKSMYDYQLITNDGSFGAHNIPFVDAMLNAMVNNLDSPGLPK